VNGVLNQEKRPPLSRDRFSWFSSPSTVRMLPHFLFVFAFLATPGACDPSFDFFPFPFFFKLDACDADADLLSPPIPLDANRLKTLTLGGLGARS